MTVSAHRDEAHPDGAGSDQRTSWAWTSARCPGGPWSSGSATAPSWARRSTSTRTAVMDAELAATGDPLPPDWALQDPEDYRDVLRAGGARRGPGGGHRPGPGHRHRHRLHRVHGAAGAARRHPAVPAARPGRAGRTPTSSCGSTTPPSRRRTGSTRWPTSAASRGSRRYGGKISAEWQFAKALQLLEEDPEIYRPGRPLDRGRRLDHLAAEPAPRPATPAPPGTRASTRTATTRRGSSWPR